MTLSRISNSHHSTVDWLWSLGFIRVVLAILGDNSSHLLAMATGQTSAEEAHWQPSQADRCNEGLGRLKELMRLDLLLL